MSWKRAVLAAALLAAATLGGLAGCEPASSVALIRERGVLVVATLNGPTTYYEGAHGPQGAEYELASAFARELGVTLEMRTVDGPAELRKALASGSVDLVAAGISPDVEWNRIGRASDVYQEIPQIVVTRRGRGGRIANIGALRGKRVVVHADSPQAQVLQTLHDTGAPWLQWREVDRDAHDPLTLVSTGEADYALLDAHEFPYLQHVYPDITIALTLPDPREARWVVRRRAPDLATRVDAFLAGLKNAGTLQAMLRAATPDSPEFEFLTAQRLQQDIEESLPHLWPHFEAAARETGVDWRLLAALAYVESRWKGEARSGDGASGIMMLTENTATSLGVTDRHDPEQSILGGARYFVQVRGKIPARIPEPDRTWFALAAYNVGYGHLEDARVLAQQRGGNPDSWTDVREALPLLTQEEYYSRARHGYARGWEPAKMVDQVQMFLRLLEIHETRLTSAVLAPTSP